jgi:hypothetical protein
MKGFIKKLLREDLSKFTDDSESINDKLIPVEVNEFVYHSSNPHFKDEILKKGLVPKGKSETWLSDTPIEGAVIFATNSDNKNDWFESGYDDDIYRIDTTKLENKWFLDPNFGDENNQHVITFEPIPLSALKLVHEGTGKEYQ